MIPQAGNDSERGFMMMLFFQAKRNMKDSCHSRQIKQYKTKFAPLQVRNPDKKSYDYIVREKRALSWTSCRMGGSLSLEAAMCLSLFLFVCVCLMMPMKIMDRQRRIQAVVESVGEELSQYAYVEYCFRTGDEEKVDTERADEAESGSLLAAGYAAARILGRIDSSWVESVSFEGTDIGTDDMVQIIMKYRMRLPFSVLGNNSIPVTHVCSRRMWNGADGNRNSGYSGTEKDEEEIVYIGKDSTRYHRQRTCHYLYNELKAVPAAEAASLRNRSGGKYAPCRRCGAGSGGGTVYVMPYGTSYHTTQSCTSIIAYVQAVPLSQVESLGACSYCGGE